MAEKTLVAITTAAVTAGATQMAMILTMREATLMAITTATVNLDIMLLSLL
jgi:hypothetical protein